MRDAAEQAGRQEADPCCRRRRGAASCRSPHRAGCRRSRCCPCACSGRSSVSVSATSLVSPLVEVFVPPVGLARIGEEGALVDVEVELDRIERDDVGQDRLVGVDEVALGDEPARDAPRQRRLDLGEFEVELRLPHGRLRAVELGLGGQEGLPALVEELVGDVAGPAQLLGAVEIALREFEPDLGGRDGRSAPARARPGRAAGRW